MKNYIVYVDQFQTTAVDQSLFQKSKLVFTKSFPFNLVSPYLNFDNLQPWPLAIKRLLNNPYENEVTLRGQTCP